jgi:acetyl coenzyme A synthetase (ADP forming)-like protein
MKKADALLHKAKKQGRALLSFAECAELLKIYRIPFCGGTVAADAKSAVAAARRLGYPVAMKIASPDIVHKSEAGGVRLGIGKDGDVRKAFAAIVEAAGAYKPGAAIEGVLVQSMAPQGVELVAGAKFSRQFGPAVMFGMGGVSVEIMKDVVFRLAPVTRDEALAMMKEIHAAPLLEGFRGRPAVKKAAVADILEKLSRLVADHPEIVEADLNPVIASGRGAVVADVRMMLGEPKRVSRTAYSTDQILAATRRIFQPRGIAVIGASNDPAKLGCSTMKNILGGGYRGKVYPINPKGEEIMGLKSYRDILEVPDPVDAAIVVIPAKFIPDEITKIGKRGIAGAVVLASGFAETGNVQLQEELLARAREYGVRILGPNIFGIYYTPEDLCATFCVPYTERGAAAFTAQSGGVGMAIIGYTRKHKMGISAIVGVGNKSDVDEDDLIEYFGQDPNTRVIVMHAEDIKDGDAFIRAAQKVGKTKPIVVLKSGATQLGERATSFHTGALAGDDRIYNAAFAKAGVVRAPNLEGMLDYARIFQMLPVPKGENILVITGAGGLGALIADGLSRHGLSLMKMDPDLDAAFRKFIPPFGATGNPVDITGGEPPTTYEATIRLALEDDRVDALVLGYWHTLITPPMTFAKVLVQVKREVEKTKTPKPVVAALSGDVEAEAAAAYLEENGIPAFPYTSERPVAALAALFRWARMCRE